MVSVMRLGLPFSKWSAPKGRPLKFGWTSGLIEGFCQGSMKKLLFLPWNKTNFSKRISKRCTLNDIHCIVIFPFFGYDARRVY